MSAIDRAIKRLRKIVDTPDMHPDDIRLDVKGTLYELHEVRGQIEAASKIKFPKPTPCPWFGGGDYD